MVAVLFLFQCCLPFDGVALLVLAANQQASHPVSVRRSWLIVNNVNRYWAPVGGWLGLRDQPIVSHIVPSTQLTTHDIIVTSLPSAALPFLQVQCNQRIIFNPHNDIDSVAFMFEDG